MKMQQVRMKTTRLLENVAQLHYHLDFNIYGTEKYSRVCQTMTFYVQNENDKDFEDYDEMTLLILWGSYLQFLSPQTSPNIPFNLFSMALSAIFSHSTIYCHDDTLRHIFSAIFKIYFQSVGSECSMALSSIFSNFVTDKDLTGAFLFCLIFQP